MATVVKKGTTTTKAAPAATGVQAYCMATKQKETVDNGVVEKTERGQYIVKGTATKDKHKVSVITSQANAEQLIKDKIVKKGY